MKYSKSVIIIIALIGILLIGFFGMNNLSYFSMAQQDDLEEVSEDEEFIFDIVYQIPMQEEDIEKISELGVNHLTVHLFWAEVEHENDIYDFSIPDKDLEIYTKYNMPPKAILINWWDSWRGSPNWLSDYEETDEEFIAELEEFAEEAAKHYDIDYWMIGNEMNPLHWNNPEDDPNYIDLEKVELYKNISAAVNRGDSDAKVGTRLAFDDLDTDVATWDNFLDAIKYDSDWVGIQVYPVGVGAGPQSNYILASVQKTIEFSSLPVWVTETGASTCQCLVRREGGGIINNWQNCEQGIEECDQWVNEELQREYIYSNVFEAYNAGAIGVSVYDYVGDDNGYSLVDEEQYREGNYKPKLGYEGYQLIISDLS